MPVKSKAQRRKFAELLVEGKITPETFEEWNRGAGSKELPERLHPKPEARRTRSAKTKTAKTARKAASKSRTSAPARRTPAAKR